MGHRWDRQRGGLKIQSYPFFINIQNQDEVIVWNVATSLPSLALRMRSITYCGCQSTHHNIRYCFRLEFLKASGAGTNGFLDLGCSTGPDREMQGKYVLIRTPQTFDPHRVITLANLRTFTRLRTKVRRSGTSEFVPLEFPIVIVMHKQNWCNKSSRSCQRGDS